MLLLNIVCMTASNITFYITLTFMKQETEVDSAWLLKQLQGGVGDKKLSRVVDSDRDRAPDECCLA